MANRTSYDLANLNGIRLVDLQNALDKLESKQANHNPKELFSITKCRLKFIQQLKDAIKPKKRVKRGTYNKCQDLVIAEITSKQWKAFYHKYNNNKTLLKKHNISNERRKRLEYFNAWFEVNRPPKGKRGRPKGTTKDSTIH